MTLLVIQNALADPSVALPLKLSSKPLVFDSSRVPWGRRYLLRLLDITGWTLWLLLWLPMTSSAQKFLGSGGRIHIALLGLFSAVGFGALAVLIMVAIFAGWTQNQHRCALSLKRKLRRARNLLEAEVLAKLFAINHQSLSRWQNSQIMLAHHSDDTGWLQHIEELPMITNGNLYASPPALFGSRCDLEPKKYHAIALVCP